MGTSYDHDDQLEHEHQAHAPEPVHVHLGTAVLPTRGSRPRSTTVEQAPAGVIGTAVRVLGNNPNRCRAYLLAVGGDVYLGPTSSVSPTTGYKLPAASSIPLEVRATEALWAIPDPAAPATTAVHVLAEHYDG